jgi:hypothetical protein
MIIFITARMCMIDGKTFLNIMTPVRAGLMFCQVEEHCRLNCAYHLSLAMQRIQVVEAERNAAHSQVASLQQQVHALTLSAHHHHQRNR